MEEEILHERPVPGAVIYISEFQNKLAWKFDISVSEPSSIPYRTHSACAKRAAYPDPPPVIPVPDTGVAQSDSQHFKGLRRGVLRTFWDLKAENGVFFRTVVFLDSIFSFLLIF